MSDLPPFKHLGKWYVVEKHEPDLAFRVRYIIRERTGEHGEHYGVIESSISDGLFFVTNLSDAANPTPFDGFRLMERDGRLQVWNP